MIYLFWISIIGIIYTFIGYPLSLYIISKLFKIKKIEKWDNIEEYPEVTYIIAAYNEEKNIRKKLENTVLLDYPKKKLEIIIASDGSSDKTNNIVEEFIKENKT